MLNGVNDPLWASVVKQIKHPRALSFVLIQAATGPAEPTEVFSSTVLNNVNTVVLVCQVLVSMYYLRHLKWEWAKMDNFTLFEIGPTQLWGYWYPVHKKWPLQS